MARKTDIRLRRSNTAGAIPTNSNLSLGELAINTADGALYFKKADGTVITAHDNTILHIDSDASNSGAHPKVGIGTTSPALQSGGIGLHIHDATNSEIKFTNDTTGALAADGTALVTSGSSFSINNREAGLLHFGTSNTTRMSISSAGLVGIGTQSPGVQLDIESSGNNSQLELTATDGTDQSFGIFSATGNNSNGAGFYIQDKTANAIRVKIDSSGNVGIGQTDPTAKLDILGSKDSTNVQISAPLNTVGGGSLADFNQIFFDNSHVSGTSGQAYIRHLANSHNDSEGAFAFGTTTTSGTTAEALRIRGDGKVGIGTTTPVDELQVAGAIALNNSRFAIQEGNYTKLYANNGEIKIYLGGADQNNYYDNNGHIFRARNTAVEQARITSTGIGIGTSSPAEPLDIRGSDPKIRLQDTDGTNQIATVFNAASTLTLQTRNNTSNGQIRFTGYNGTAVTEYARFDTSGKLGIGTASPATKLHISESSSSTTPELRITNDTPESLTLGVVRSGAGTAPDTSFISFDNALRFIGQTGTTNERMRITEAGLVGIGTTTPSTPLQISNAGAFTPFRVTNTTNSVQLDVEALADNVTIGVATNHHLNFQTNNATRLTIKNNGNVGIGETSPDAKLDVRVSSATEYSSTEASELNPVATDALYLFNEEASSTNGKVSILMRDTGSGGGAAGRITLVNDRAGDGSFAFLLRDSAHTTEQQEKMRITSDGNLGIGTNNPGARLQVNGSTADNSAFALIARNSGGTSLLSARNDGRIDIPGSAVLGSTLTVSGTSTFSDKLTLSGTTDEILTLNSTDDGAVYMSFERSNDRHAYVGFGGSGDAFQITNEESGGSIQLRTGGAAALTIDASQNATFAGNVVVPDNKRLKIGSSNDLSFIHDGTNTYVQNTTGNLDISNTQDDGDIIFKSDDGSGGITQYFRLDGGSTKSVFSQNAQFDDNARLLLGSGGDFQAYHDGTNTLLRNFTGDLTVQADTDNGSIFFRSDDGSGGTALYMRVNGSDELINFHKNSKHMDSVKATFGDSADLEIYHDGTRSIIKDAGTGDLLIRATNLKLQNADGTNYLNGISEGEVSLFHNNSKKFETTSAGASVTGDLAISGNLTVSGSTTTLNTATLDVEDKNITLNKGSGDTSGSAAGAGITIQDAVDASNDATILWDQTNSEFDFSHPVNASNIITSAAFSGTTTKTLTLTQSGGGTITAAFTDISGGGSSTSMADADNDTKIQVEESSDEDKIRFDTAGTQRMLIDSDGEIGIGTNNPTAKLHVNGGTGNVGFRVDTTDADPQIRLTTLGQQDWSIGVDYSDGGKFKIDESGTVGTLNALTIDASRNVGIGTTSPQTELEISAAQSPFLRLTSEKDGSHDAGDIYGELQFFTQETYGNAPVVSAKIQSLHTRAGSGHSNGDAGLAFFTSLATNDATATERMRIESATGNVGIGTTAPAHELVLRKDQAAATEFSIVNLTDDNAASTSLRFRNATSASETGNGAFLQLDKFNVFRIVNQFGNPLIFGTNNAEKARIDSSGRLLIGKTAADNATVGFRFDGASGFASFARDGGEPLYLNRKTSDGIIQKFAKDDTVIGSISVDNSDNLVIEGDSSHSGLQFGSATILPHKNGAAIDNNISLGNSTYRFSNLHVGGTINMGGAIRGSAGSATKLIFNATAARTEIHSAGTSGIDFRDNGNNVKMAMDGNGNLGIGTTSPSQLLEVVGAGGSGVLSRIRLRQLDDGSGNAGATVSLRSSGFGEGYLEIGSHLVSGTGGDFNVQSATDLVLKSGGNNTRMYISSAGNIGIGTTTPTAKLNVAGTIKSSGTITSTNGTVTNVMSFSDRGIFGTTSNHPLELRTNNTERVRITAAGKVGIGTTSPSQPLQINTGGTSGGMQITSTDADAFIHFNETSDNKGFFLSLDGNNNSGSNHSLSFFSQTGGTNVNRMMITNGGDVGIGTTAPSAKLDVTGNFVVDHGNWTSSDVVNISTDQFDAGATFQTGEFVLFGDHDGSANKMLSLKRAGTDVFMVDRNGNVGIGTASPSKKLHVQNGSSGFSGSYNGRTAAIIEGSNSAGTVLSIMAPNTGYSGIFLGDQNGEASGIVLYDHSVNAMKFFTNNGEKVRIDASGNVGIGTNSPGAKLHVNSSSTIGWSDLANAHILAGTTSAGIGIDTNEIFCKGAGHLYFGTSSAGGDIKFRSGGTAEAMTISGTNQRVGIAKTTPLARFQVEEYGIDTTAVTSTATTQIALHSFPITSFRSARFTVQITNNADDTYHTTEILAIHDGTTANMTEFGTIFTGAAAEATFDADVNSGNFRLLATPATTDSMQFKVVCHSITI